MLALIMSVPMVVASRISLQYFGSAVDNRAFGSGNSGPVKEQGVHPVASQGWSARSACSRATAAISTHEMVRELVDNGWLHLFAKSGESARVERRVGAGNREAA